MPSPARSSLSVLACWTAALAAASFLLVATRFSTRDPDSALYVTIASHLAEHPIRTWIAPEWWGGWNHTGPFREHPAGAFVVPALLTRLGIPGEEASFIVNLAAQIVCLLTLTALAARVLGAARAQTLLWTLQLLPIAFVFRIRANHEYPLLAGVLVAIYGLERLRGRWAWLLVALGGFVYALFVKGVFAGLGPAVAAVWLLVVPPREGDRNSRAWVGIVLMGVVTLAAGYVYERMYVATTGLSFFDYYFGVQLRSNRLQGGHLPVPINKIWNAIWYLGRILWYATPWSVLLIAAFLRRRTWPAAERPWLRFCLGGTLMTVGLLALNDSRADRYMFPAFYLSAAGGTIVALEWWPSFRRLADRAAGTWPWGPAAWWFVLFLSRLVLR